MRLPWAVIVSETGSAQLAQIFSRQPLCLLAAPGIWGICFDAVALASEARELGANAWIVCCARVDAWGLSLNDI